APRMIYLDNNASTKLDPIVLEAMAAASGLYANPSSIHAEGRRARRAVEEAREDVARLAGCAAEEVFFTSGGTEANAMAIFGATESRPGRVVRSGAEHPSVREAVDRLGGSITVDPDSSGRLDPSRVAAEAKEVDVRLVTVMTASNEYGALFPVAEIVRAVRSSAPAVLLHTDAVQAAGRVPLAFGDWGIDLMSLSAHKMHGPRGAGALVIRKGVRLAVRTAGGGQEKRLRAGTENTAAIAGFAAAARLARERLATDAPRMAALRDRLELGILSNVPDARVLARDAPRLPNTSAIRFADASAEMVLIRLDLEGIAASAGSACSSGTLAPSPAVLSLGLGRTEAGEVVRFSLSRLTTQEEIDVVVRALPEIVRSVRAASRPASVGAAAEGALR
ncbi:MAG TPA: cysteine desulfurase family protein, partial [Thermoanaerobaculia bacterium]|nr:cysteine desulfurase family protein [Thermoanaerobaculia bacterium]